MVKVQILKNGSTPFHFKVNADDLNLNDEVDSSNFDGDILIDGEIINGGSLLEVKGIIKCRKSFICDRCLAPSSEDQIHEFNEELDRSDIEDDFVDLTEIAHDIILASQPIQNLCKEDCKGLCPVCGVNLNESDCKCDRLIVDPRLEALKNLLVEKE